MRAPESITIEPMPRIWLEGLRTRPELTAEQRRFRQELGLPTDGRVVMTGHQAEFWHPGILAKYFACDAAARAMTAAGVATSPAWLVVDQDANEPGNLRFPAIRQAADGGFELLGDVDTHFGVTCAAGTPVCEVPTVAPTDEQMARARRERAATPSVARGVDLAIEVLRRHAGAADAGEQHVMVLRELLASLGLHAPIVRAMALARTTLFRTIIEHMARDPEPCVQAYNAAVAAAPEAGLTPLLANEVQDRFELPLWHIRRGMPRERVYAEDLANISLERLAPRALLMTAVFRLGGCDFFVHGLGGGVYDKATDMWIHNWIGDALLAPTGVVTATRYLEFGRAERAEPLERALWRMHHARHDPVMLGDNVSAEKKMDFVSRIADAKARREDAKPLYREMLELLENVRRARRNELRTIELAAERSRADALEEVLRSDRTWAFVLHDEQILRELGREIDRRFLAK